MSTSDVAASLANTELFHDLSEDHLERLERVAHRRHFEPGEVIVREGQGGIAFFVVTTGRVSISRADAEGQQRELRTAGPGDVFGEMALFSDRPRSATITAVETTECLALHRFEFLDELRRSPEVALRLLDSLAVRLDHASALS